MEMKIVWDRKAFLAVNKILDYISQDSFINAGKVAKDIEEVFQKVVAYPLIFPPDKFKRNRDTSYRAFELHKIRISYKVEEDRILVVRCRHTKQNTLYY